MHARAPMTGVDVERHTLPGDPPLEVLRCTPEDTPRGAPLVFVHGAYVGAWCWAETWLPWFAAQGHAAYALSLRGHGRSGGRDRLHEYGLADYARDLGVLLGTLGDEPVLVGHSMGALVVQKHLERARCHSAAFLCPVPPSGVLAASFSLAFTRPALFGEIQAMALGRRVSLDALRSALFAGAVDADRLARVYARMQPESQRAILDMSGWGLPLGWRRHAGRVLVLGAECDALIPEVLARSAARLIDAEYVMLPRSGHAVMLETGWRAGAQTLVEWLEAGHV